MSLVALQYNLVLCSVSYERLQYESRVLNWARTDQAIEPAGPKLIRLYKGPHLRFSFPHLLC